LVYIDVPLSICCVCVQKNATEVNTLGFGLAGSREQQH